MGESKRRERIASDLTEELTDKGKLIEADLALFADTVIPKNAPPPQLVETQLAFMAGAEHVWSSMMSMLDPGEEPTEADLRRMDLIQQELNGWRARMSERVNQLKENEGQPESHQLPPDQRLGDAPVEAQYRKKMIAIMRGLDEFINDGAKGAARKTGVVLMVFPYGDTSGRWSYMSNGANRQDVVVLLKEMLARSQGGSDQSGSA